MQRDSITHGHLLGGVLAQHVGDTDFGNVGRRPIGSEMSAGHSLHDTVDRLHEVAKGDPAGLDWRARVRSRRHFDCTPRTRPAAADIMYRRVQPPQPCTGAVGKWSEDGPWEGRARVPVLHTPDPDGGMLCLHSILLHGCVVFESHTSELPTGHKDRLPVQTMLLTLTPNHVQHMCVPDLFVKVWHATRPTNQCINAHAFLFGTCRCQRFPVEETGPKTSIAKTEQATFL